MILLSRGNHLFLDDFECGSVPNTLSQKEEVMPKPLFWIRKWWFKWYFCDRRTKDHQLGSQNRLRWLHLIEIHKLRWKYHFKTTLISPSPPMIKPRQMLLYHPKGKIEPQTITWNISLNSQVPQMTNIICNAVTNLLLVVEKVKQRNQQGIKASFQLTCYYTWQEISFKKTNWITTMKQLGRC